MRNTGMPRADATDDFLRARRKRTLGRVASRLRGSPADVDVIVPFDEVVQALGRTGERTLGEQVIELDSIVGTVDRGRDFDRKFRPTSGRVRPRWERIARAQRKGEAMPPIDVYRIGEAHFVKDGHHRVSVARAHGQEKINAYVTEVLTRVGAERSIRISDLPHKSHERLFAERVPLPAEGRRHFALRDPTRYAELAEGVEAWGFRVMQGERRFLPRDEIARRWYEEEYVPTVKLLREAGLLEGGDDETGAYLRLSADRFRLLRTHDWTEEALEEVKRVQ